MIVRPATRADLPAVEAVRIATWQVAYRGIVPDVVLDTLRVDDDRVAALESRYDEGSAATWVAEDGGALVGMAVAGPCRDEDLPGGRELYALYVLPSSWGHGVGQALWDAALPFASLWVLADNARARAFYARNGFRPEATKVVDIGGPLVEVRYLLA